MSVWFRTLKESQNNHLIQNREYLEGITEARWDLNLIRIKISLVSCPHSRIKHLRSVTTISDALSCHHFHKIHTPLTSWKSVSPHITTDETLSYWLLYSMRIVLTSMALYVWYTWLQYHLVVLRSTYTSRAQLSNLSRAITLANSVTVACNSKVTVTQWIVRHSRLLGPNPAQFQVNIDAVELDQKRRPYMYCSRKECLFQVAGSTMWWRAVTDRSILYSHKLQRKRTNRFFTDCLGYKNNNLSKSILQITRLVRI